MGFAKARWTLFGLLLALPAALYAQQPVSQPQQPGSRPKLTARQHEGRLLFQQRCPICHSSVMITHKPYGPILDRDLVEGNEELVRDTILNGRPGRMPAFKYGLTSAEVDAIIDYLLTVTTAPERSFGAHRGAAVNQTGDQ